MRTLGWLLLALVAFGTHASWTPEVDDPDCIEWAYEPVVEYLDPPIGQQLKVQPTYEGNVYNGIELLHATEPIEMLDEFKPVSHQLPEEFHGPKFDEGQIELLYAPTTAAPLHLPQDFHGPKFDEGQVEFLQAHSTTTTSAPIHMPEDYLGPKFEDGQIELLQVPTTSTVAPIRMPEDFYLPRFEDGGIVMLDAPARSTPDPMRMPEDVYLPKLEDGAVVMLGESSVQTQQPSSEYQLPEYRSASQHSSLNGKPLYESAPVTKSYLIRPEVVPIHDEFASGVYDKAKVESVDSSSEANVDVHDEFVVRPRENRPKKMHYAKEERSDREYYPKEDRSEKEYYPRHERYYTKKPSPPVKHHYPTKQHPVTDGFVDKRPHETVTEPADVPPYNAKVRDEFVTESEKSKEVYPKKTDSSFDRVFGKPFYEPGPVAQFFLDLIGAEAPVHDSFSSGISEKTEVESIRELPEHKADVHDEFTFAEEEKSAYRAKRSVNTDPSPASNSLWKLVCVKRRPKHKPRVLTAADYLDAQVELNDRISRCVGRYEGEHVAAGLCRKYYLRCTAPTISVLMCSHMGEVFSEAMKQCVPKIGLGECDIKRAVRSRMISFSLEKNANKSTEPVIAEQNVIQGDITSFCLEKADGFYRDPKDCSRVLQCFDNDLFEYPSCSEPLVFDVRRGICDYRAKVSDCTNN